MTLASSSHDDRVEWARIVAAELQRLPIDQAAILGLVYVQRLPLPQAAARLRIQLDLAVTVLADGLRNLAAAIEATRTR